MADPIRNSAGHMRPADEANEVRAASLRTEMERRIQNMLLDLEAETGHEIDHVDVDSRNFANHKVEIYWK